MSTETPDNFTRYHDKSCPHSHLRSLREDNARWLAQKDADIDSVVRMARIRDENPAVSLAVAEAVRDDDHRAVLMALADGAGTTTYDGIEPLLNASRRTVRRRVNELVERDIVAVDDSKPAVVHFPSKPIELLVQDSLNKFFTR